MLGSTPSAHHPAKSLRRLGQGPEPRALVVAVALANKTARIAWAVMLREKEYQPRAVAA
jgi:hypothetical protein